MEIRQLEYFVAVAETGSFSEGAACCHVSQPSLSQQIIKLERHLGCQLFDRLGRSIALTEAGRALLPRARAILAGVREAERDLSLDLESGRGQLAIGAIPTIAPYLLPPAVRRFVKAYPHAELSICEDVTAELIDRLLSARSDLCLLSLPLDHDQIATETLTSEPLLVVASPETDVARMPDLYLDAVRDRPVVVLHEMHCLGQQIRGFCQGHGIRQRIVCYSTQLTTVQSMVALGLGISIVPRMCAAADTSNERVYKRLRDAEPRRTIVAAWRRGRDRSWLVARFLDEIRKEVANLDALDDATFCR